ncbi:hypothetical protein O6461_25870, partial [Salmonella enterica subsp. enterica]
HERRRTPVDGGQLFENFREAFEEYIAFGLPAGSVLSREPKRRVELISKFGKSCSAIDLSELRAGEHTFDIFEGQRLHEQRE